MQPPREPLRILGPREPWRATAAVCSGRPETDPTATARHSDPTRASWLTFAAALGIHPWAGKPLSQPISFELRNGNPIAYLTLCGLGLILCMLTRTFWRSRNHVSALAAGSCIAFLVIIPATHPLSALHNLAFFCLIGVASGLFLLWALDTFDLLQVVPPLLPIAFGLTFLTSLGIGGLQLMLIGSLLLALNLTHRHLERRLLR